MQIEVQRILAAKPFAAFRAVGHIADWPMFIRSVSSVEMLTHGHLHAGSRLRITRIMFGHETTEEAEVMEMERPHRLRLATHSRDLHYERDHVIDAVQNGSRLMLILRTRPVGDTERAAQDFISPLMEINVRDELERDLSDFAAAIHHSAGAK